MTTKREQAIEQAAKNTDPRAAHANDPYDHKRMTFRIKGIRKFGHKRTGMAFFDEAEWFKPFPDELEETEETEEPA